MKKLIFAVLMSGSLSITAQGTKKDSITLESLKKETNQTVLQQKIKTLENGSAEDMFLLTQYYGKKSSKKDAVIKKLNKKYPDTGLARMARMSYFLDTDGSVKETEAVYKNIAKQYPNINIDFEKNMVALAYAEIADAPGVIKYINAMEDPVYKAFALPMSIELIAPIDTALALELSARELENVNKLKGQTALSNALKLDPKQAYDEYINMYGKLLFKAGKDKEAYKYTKEAFSNIEHKDQELIGNYAFLSSSIDEDYEQALPVLVKIVKDGNNEKRYIDQVRIGYKKLNPDKDAEVYIASLQQGFIEKIKAHAKELMVNKPAPDFYVKDVNGKKVTLADFKGKTIVLDFWATWCGPCVASFPAMQMAANHYADDPDIKFLFIHTWENKADPLTDAKQFLSRRNYNFDLFMDTIDSATKTPPAAEAFKLTGIPAKFIIDGQGKIRFQVEGFEGTAEEAAQEVIQMVEMARLDK